MKRTMARDLGIGALALGIAAGCAPAVHTSQYYAAHPQERKARLQVCERLGITQYDRDCVNAEVGGLRAATHGISAGNPWASK